MAEQGFEPRVGAGRRRKSICKRKGPGAVIPHPDITVHRPELFRGNGIHMSEFETDIFLTDQKKGASEPKFLAWVAGVGHINSPML